MQGELLRTQVLSMQTIPNADPMLLQALNVRPHERSLGIITTDCDDVSYAALDEATKKAAVRVVYARSMYAGAANASTKLAGEFIGILAGPDPAEVVSGLEACRQYIAGEAAFISANADNSIIYFAHCISRSGSYLSAQAQVPEGTALAYLIAAPQEAICGLDAALKAAEVQLRLFYGPPSETNFAGALLSGEQAACQAACEAFAARILDIANQPLIY